MLHTAARAAQSSRNPLALARALCSMTPLPGASPTTSVPDPVFRSLAETALGWLPPSEATWRIRMLALLGSHLADTDDPEQGAAMVREAVAAARQLDDATTVGRALLSQRFRGGPLELDERLECGSELVELGDRLNVEVFSSVGRQQLWWCYRELGEREQADHWYGEAAERMPLPDLEQLSYPPSVALLDGDLRHADHLTNVLSDAHGDTPLGRGYAAVCAWPSQTIGAGSRIPDSWNACWRPTSGSASWSRGCSGGAWRAAAGWPMHASSSTALDVMASPPGTPRRRGTERHMLGRGRRHRCRHRRSERSRSRVRAPGRSIRGRRAVGLGHGRSGPGVAAADHRGRAWGGRDRDRSDLASRRRRTPVFLARELIVLASAQQHLGVDDTDDLVAEAFAIARRTAARLIVHDARLHLGQRHAVQAPDQFGLTRREREVVDLVAAGASNTQVATALAISPSTVRKHLEHAYEKLNVSSRTAAAALTADSRSSRSAPSQAP